MTNTPQATAEELTGPQFILLEPGNYPPRTGPQFNRILTSDTEIEDAVFHAMDSQLLVVDFETKGGDFSLDIEIMGIGMAWDRGSCYIEGHMINDHVLSMLQSHKGLIAHNVYFDGGVAKKVFGFHPNWFMCTYTLLAMLHNESPESRWGLKDAQVNLLGWAESNDKELDEWLVVNGFYRGAKRIDNSPENLKLLYDTGKLKPEKGEMWNAPTEILGKYCILDAESTYLLFIEVLAPVARKFPEFQTFVQYDQMLLIRILIDQRIAGIPMDVDGMNALGAKLMQEADGLTEQFVVLPEVVQHIRDMEDAMLAPLRLRAPAEFTKKGTVSKNYTNWQERLAEAEAGKNPDYRFNMQSGDQLRELLYDKLGNKPRMFTDSGLPSTAGDAVKHMGEPGLLLLKRSDNVKALTYVNKYLELAELGNRSTVHPSFRAPGTVTGRLTSKEPNMQQIEKTHRMMSLFQARPGCVWVDLDFQALEPTVVTEFSNDPNMELIYGDGRPQNDIYLFVASTIPGMGRRIAATGYDRHNPTKESIARAKKECKADRNVCKTVVLACNYGAGVNKIIETLEADNIYMTYDEVAAIHRGYWDLFSGVKDFGKSLYFEWRKNGGYILNATGRPMAVPDDYSKDLLNRFIQSTGHDILTRYIRLLNDELSRNEIPWTPIIIDFHDSSCVEVSEDRAQDTVDCFNRAMARLNEELGGRIKLKGSPCIGRNLAEAKEVES